MQNTGTTRIRQIAEANLCPVCGYDCALMQAPRCPECGAELHRVLWSPQGVFRLGWIGWGIWCALAWVAILATACEFRIRASEYAAVRDLHLLMRHGSDQSYYGSQVRFAETVGRPAPPTLVPPVVGLPLAPEEILQVSRQMTLNWVVLGAGSLFLCAFAALTLAHRRRPTSETARLAMKLMVVGMFVSVVAALLHTTVYIMPESPVDADTATVGIAFILGIPMTLRYVLDRSIKNIIVSVTAWQIAAVVVALVSSVLANPWVLPTEYARAAAIASPLAFGVSHLLIRRSEPRRTAS